MTIHDQWTALYTAGRVRWMAGMRTEHGHTIISVSNGDVYAYDDEETNLEDSIFHIPPSVHLPDFTDPATEGCLLHQAREAWDAVAVNAHVSRHHMLPGGEKWVITIGSQQPGIERPTRVAAILAAIAAAPPKVNP